jgi:hypothetical protein
MGPLLRHLCVSLASLCDLSPFALMHILEQVNHELKEAAEAANRDKH